MSYKKMSAVMGVTIVIVMVLLQVCVFHRKPITNINVAKIRGQIIVQNLNF